MMSTTTLLIGYYHGLLLRSIDADMLTDKMCSVGLLTAHEQFFISSGHSVYQKNQLLLYHVQHMNVQALLTFCELVQDFWPQIGSQLITGMYIIMCYSHFFISFFCFTYIQISVFKASVDTHISYIQNQY